MKHPSPQNILGAFSGKRVLVVGDVMLDEYVWGDVKRLCPEAPVPVVVTKNRTVRPGGAGNAAANVSALGGIAILGGVVGRDSEARVLRSALRDREVADHELLVVASRPTTVKTRIMARGQQMLRIDREHVEPLANDSSENLYRWVERQLPDVDACLLSDYGKGIVTPDFARRMLQAAARWRRPVVVDPKGTDYSCYRGAAILKPNMAEFCQACGVSLDTDQQLRAAGTKLASQLPGTTIIVTRGPMGMTLFRAGLPPAQLAAMPVSRVFDVTGAGDTVAAVLALALASGADVEDAAELAGLAAGFVVSNVGTGVAIASELRAALVLEESWQANA